MRMPAGEVRHSHPAWAQGFMRDLAQLSQKPKHTGIHCAKTLPGALARPGLSGLGRSRLEGGGKRIFILDWRGPEWRVILFLR